MKRLISIGILALNCACGATSNVQSVVTIPDGAILTGFNEYGPTFIGANPVFEIAATSFSFGSAGGTN